MPVEIEIKITPALSQTELFDLRDELSRYNWLSNVHVKNKPALPGQMCDGIPDCIIKAVVEAVVEAGLDNFIKTAWEPHIAPFFKKFLGRKKAINKAGEMRDQSIELDVAVSDGISRSYFTIDSEGYKQRYDNVTYSIDPKKTYAILIGCSDYKYSLNAIPPVEGNLKDMYSLFTDMRYIGLPSQNVFICFNETADTIKDILYTNSRLDMIG